MIFMIFLTSERVVHLSLWTSDLREITNVLVRVNSMMFEKYANFLSTLHYLLKLKLIFLRWLLTWSFFRNTVAHLTYFCLARVMSSWVVCSFPSLLLLHDWKDQILALVMSRGNFLFSNNREKRATFGIFLHWMHANILFWKQIAL